MERLLACMFVLTLSGCATEEYWTHYTDEVQVKHVVHVDFPCKKFDTDGCWNAKANTVEVRKGLSKPYEDCVISHERKHAKGYTHPRQAIVFAQDCGDGTML